MEWVILLIAFLAALTYLGWGAYHSARFAYRRGYNAAYKDHGDGNAWPYPTIDVTVRQPVRMRTWRYRHHRY